MISVLEILAVAFDEHGGPGLAEAVRVWGLATNETDARVALTAWVCRRLVPLAMDAANLTIDAQSLRDLTGGDDDVCRHLDAFVAKRALDAETTAYERGEYRALITVLDVDDTAVMIGARAVEQAVGPSRSLSVASRALRQLVGPAVVDFDYWRERSASVPAGFSDGDADRECDRAELRYRRFFDLDEAVRASLESALRSLVR